MKKKFVFPFIMVVVIAVAAVLLICFIQADVAGGSDPTNPSQTDSGSEPSNPTSPSLPTIPVNPVVTFPYKIPGTTLVVSSIISYEGIYLEDGSDEKIAGVAAILVTNEGKTAIEYTSITLMHKDNTLLFEASVIPAGASVVIQEKNRQDLPECKFSSCTAVAAELPTYSQFGENVKVIENGDGSLTVQNLTDQEIPCVRVFYKFYMREENTYVGGITYNAKVVNLKPNESQVITPSHYAEGYSQVVMVREYSSAE